jgi:hypothetical protein
MLSHRLSGIFNARLHIAVCFLALLVSFVTPVSGQQSQVLLGDTNVERTVDKSPSGTAKAFPVRAAATGQVRSLSVYLDSSNRAPTVWVGLYTSSNDHPRALMAKGVISNPAAGQWNAIAFAPVQVTKGTTYWLSLLGVNGIVGFHDSYGRCRSEVGRQRNLSALPAIWTSGFGWPTCTVSMFASGSVTGTTPSASVSISPHAIALQAGQQQQFSALFTGLNNPSVTWTATGGTISSAGLYKAPSTAGTYTVTAKATGSQQSTGAAVVTSDSAVVTVTLPTPPPPPVANVSISVLPTAASLQTGAKQQFSATVSGTTNTAVIWSASAGTITATGLYTAPSTAGTYTIKAVSNADATKSASVLAVVSVPQPVTVSVSPANTSVAQAGQVQFAATVTGLSNHAVTWTVSRGSGTITQSGLYTAPKAVETDMVTATTQADSTKSANGSVSVIAPHSVSLIWDASKSTTVAFYKVYRGTVSGGPYTLLNGNVKATVFTDSSVKSGVTYYYVTSAVDASGAESIFSNEMQSVIPSP